jgi:hypothetical protein
MRYADLWRAMKRYSPESDAWQEFIGDLDEASGGQLPIDNSEVFRDEAPEAFARRWSAIAHGRSPLFDAQGTKRLIPRHTQDGNSLH